ncbi:MAG: peptidoglycan editing factor PgeF [Nannocystaceae bacterium]|nr:peptidoglycan editing factor PgeF [Nannocystaceae bacterium]
MLDRSTQLGGVPGLVHGFSDRLGGVSTGRFATLNLGKRWGDAPQAVLDNHARLAAAGGFSPEALRSVVQVHGAEVMAAAALSADSRADGLSCARGDRRVVSVMTADCVPILLADREGTVAAAVHSGWRGTAAGIAAVAVRELVDRDARPGSLVAAIGPCIEQAAFEVGDEVAAQFDPAFVVRHGDDNPHVDLVAVVRAQLIEAGLQPSSIERIGGCTHAHPDRWFSFRRDGAGIGQMLSFIGYP